MEKDREMRNGVVMPGRFDPIIWRRQQAEKAAFHKAEMRKRREGPKCKRCGYFPKSCTCQFQLTELEEFGGSLNYNKMVNADEILRLHKLDKKGVLVETLIKEAGENGN